MHSNLSITLVFLDKGKKQVKNPLMGFAAERLWNKTSFAAGYKGKGSLLTKERAPPDKSCL